jgi:hypothetical protein
VQRLEVLVAVMLARERRWPAERREQGRLTTQDEDGSPRPPPRKRLRRPRAVATVAADTAAGGCTELAAALAALPFGLLEMVADAVAALGCADA